MSICIHYITNGEKSIYRYRNAMTDPVTVEIYENKEDIPLADRHFADKLEPNFVSPDTAYMFGTKVGQFLYPDFPICKNTHPDYIGLRCIGDCRYLDENIGDLDFRKCPYFDKEYKHITDKTIELIREQYKEIEELIKEI